jgi:hypothetical protein
MTTSSCSAPAAAGSAPFATFGRVRQFAPVVYTLLDAADEAGLLHGETRATWHTAAGRLQSGGSFELEASALHDVMRRLDREGNIADTWIGERWRTISAQIARPPV